jgi:hypothetical protein
MGVQNISTRILVRKYVGKIPLGRTEVNGKITLSLSYGNRMRLAGGSNWLRILSNGRLWC